jgi:hypothetical protein
MIKGLCTTCLAIVVATTTAVSSADAASFDILLTPTADGATRMDFIASGRTETAGAGSDFTWANLVGGDPFDDALQFARVDFDPIQTLSGIHLIGLTLDSDGDGLPGGQDDLTLRFDGLVASDDLLTTVNSTRRLDLDFLLLNPGEYTRVTSAGDLNLTISASPVPWPAAAHLMLGGLAFLALAHRRATRPG